MTHFEFFLILLTAIAAMSLLFYSMRGPVTVARVMLICLWMAMLMGTFIVGAELNHDDFTCHPGQHCFPWGD